MSLIVATILAYTLNRDPILVRKVYEAQSFDRLQSVSIVEFESWFNPKAQKAVIDKKTGKQIGTAWGLWQLVDIWHPQHRGNIDAHIIEGASFLAECWVKSKGDWDKTLLRYNGGEPGYIEGVRKVYRKLTSVVLLDARYGGRL